MGTVSVDTFLPLVSLQVPACPTPIMEHSIVRAAVELCEQSLLWQVPLTGVTLASTDFPYTVPVPAYGELARILSVSYNGRHLIPTTRLVLENLGNSWQTTTGTVQYYFQDPNKTLTVYPLPAVASSLTLVVAYQPTPTATVLEDILWSNYREAVIAGALKNLYSMSGTAWYDGPLADYYNRRFADGKVAAAVDARRGQAMADLSVKMRPFA